MIASVATTRTLVLQRSPSLLDYAEAQPILALESDVWPHIASPGRDFKSGWPSPSCFCWQGSCKRAKCKPVCDFSAPTRSISVGCDGENFSSPEESRLVAHQSKLALLSIDNAKSELLVDAIKYVEYVLCFQDFIRLQNTRIGCARAHPILVLCYYLTISRSRNRSRQCHLPYLAILGSGRGLLRSCFQQVGTLR